MSIDLMNLAKNAIGSGALELISRQVYFVSSL